MTRRFFSWSVNLLRDANRWTEIVEGFGWDEEMANRAMMIADELILNCEVGQDLNLKKEIINIMGDDVEEESIDILVKNIKDSLQYEDEEENFDS